MKGYARGGLLGACALLLVWVVSFSAVWLHRSGCINGFTRACNDQILNWYVDAVTLGWVYSYQTLLAGMLAVGAGAFVLMATTAQILEGRRIRAEDRRDAARGILANMRSEMTQLVAKLRATESQELDLAPAFAVASRVSTVHPWLGERCSQAIGFVDGARRAKRATNSVGERERVAAGLFLFVLRLSQADNEFDEQGRLVLPITPLSDGHRRALNYFGVRHDQLHKLFRDLFAPSSS